MTFISIRPIILCTCLLAATFLTPYFSIAQPANDVCPGTALSSNPATTCTNTLGYLRFGSFATATTGLTGSCGITNSRDVWYYFTAQTAYPVISLSGVGTRLDDGYGIELFNTTASCTGGTLTPLSIACVTGTTTTLSLNTFAHVGGGLVVGNVYKVRVFANTTSTLGTTNAEWDFDICITDPPSNDFCENAVALNSGLTCVFTRDTLTGANYTAVPTLGCGVATRNDVWYQFVAKSAGPVVTLNAISGMGNRRIQVFSGSCAALSSMACSSTGSLTLTGLTIGNTYFVRIYTDPNATGIFDICVRDQVPNDNCTGAIDITNFTCGAPATGNMYSASLSTPTIAVPNCATGVTYDVWYRFVAQAVNPTITLSAIESAYTNPNMQLISIPGGSSCTGTVNSLYCGTTSIAANYLTVGATYYIRVYSTGVAPSSPANAGFGICVSYPAVTPPFNDNCANATNLPISAACDNFSGTIAGATLSAAPLGTCTGPATYDVWYKFTAITTSSAVQLRDAATNFTNARFQVLTGSCGSLSLLSPEACGVAATELIVATTIGTTYYIRIYSTTAGPSPSGNGIFNICVRGLNAPIRFGNSYVNISKKATGGVVQTGDTLEIRMTINHKSTAGIIYSPRFVDNVPVKTTMLTGTGDRIRIITNEGLPYKEYTLGADGDAGRYNPSPGGTEYNIRLNVGLGKLIEPATPVNTEEGSATATGLIDPSNATDQRPRGGGGVLFAIAYRVRVTGVTGDTVVLYPGKFIYQTTSGGPDITLTGTPFKILITNSQALCANSTGLNNALEDAGTFGSGTTLARTTDLSNPIAGYSYVSNPSPAAAIGDGQYSIMKNVSPRNSTNRTANQIPNCGTLPFDDPANCNNRMYSHWVIDGDHSGTDNALGNTPPASGSNGGYMLVVNADFVASEAYRQTINNLCPNTYYEFSAWIRNVCSTCGADSTGAQFTASADVSRHAGVVGVYPNLSFAVDGVDQYSTGEVDATGWEKRGFVFVTGATQTSATFTIRNNSQGGGGNDWAMDDISVSTCLPSMKYSPSTNPTLCYGNTFTIRNTIRSIYDSYKNFKWQRSTNGGSTWTDVTSESVGNPVYNGSEYEFFTTYTVPPTATTLANDGDLYRVIVATTSDNLANANCVYTDGVAIIELNIIDCGSVLNVNLLSFSGMANSKSVILNWSTSLEKEQVIFQVEKSTDGRNFSKIATIKGYNNVISATNQYGFNDTSAQSPKMFYRVALSAVGGRRTQSHVITLQNEAPAFSVDNLINPFSDNLSFDVTVGYTSKIVVVLLDAAGLVVKKKTYAAYAGLNSIALTELSDLAAGIYVLQVEHNGKTISKKVIRK
ncbi:MAG TPA: T9SS type A sorting domain-containing protein [Flavisolibacter sp.]|nr:T9SS type A sorting domain-containing protein [Flavisolibacter sp.]